MSVSMTAPRYVTRPVPSPITSTLLDHFPPKVVDHFGLMNNAGLWPSFNCLDVLNPTPMCPDPLLGDDGDPKEFDTIDWVPAYEFAVYGGVKHAQVAGEELDAQREVKRVFEENMHKGVESSLLQTRFVATTSDDPIQWAGANDRTPGSDVSVLVALAILETDAAESYNGLPTIHMPRGAATILESHGLIVWEGNKAFTKNGSRVAMGGGYSAGQSTSDGTWDLYATGEVYIEMSDQIDITTQVIPGDGLGTADPLVFEDNLVLTLAERMFRVAVDCYITKCTATVWS